MHCQFVIIYYKEGRNSITYAFQFEKNVLNLGPLLQSINQILLRFLYRIQGIYIISGI